MKVGIFALKDYDKSKDLPKFVRAAESLGMDIEIINPKNVFIDINNGRVKIRDKNGSKVAIDGAVNWIPYAKYDEIDLALSSMNIPYINSVSSVRNCRNKVLTNIILSKYNFTQPYTRYYPNMEDKGGIKTEFEYPFIYKKKSGSHGMGAKKFNTQNDFDMFLNERSANDPLYFQQYIKNEGYDYRVLVVKNKVVGGMKKYYKKGEWRTHVAHGGKVEEYDAPDDIKKACINILKAMNLHFAGVDIMTDVQGNAYVLEVNSVPGMTLLYNLSGINMAKDILLHLKHCINNT